MSSDTKTDITACIDGSSLTTPVIDAAAWASTTFTAPLHLLHVLEKADAPVTDRSGTVLPDDAIDLLDELTALDEKRGKLAMALGRHMLDDATARAQSAGVSDVTAQQRHGDLLEALQNRELATRLFVLGRRGSDHEDHPDRLGAHLESVVRAIHTPILVSVGQFQAPQRYMIAYDGSATANNAIANIADTPVLKAMVGHVVCVGADNAANQDSLNDATALLEARGHSVSAHLLQGDVVEQLREFRRANDVQMIVMGAYGHSRVRDFFVGSHTSKMIRTSKVPLLLLR
ncbi:MAG: universal stress protein [Pseudomonadota bacterium]